MADKRRRGRAAAILVLGLLAPAPASAGPYFGEWGWCWHRAPDCPRSSYSPLHYWVPGVYRLRACCHPSNLDQYAPGPRNAAAPGYDVQHYPCPSTPPAPTPPYADPAGFYGRRVVSPPG